MKEELCKLKWIVWHWTLSTSIFVFLSKNKVPPIGISTYFIFGNLESSVVKIHFSYWSLSNFLNAEWPSSNRSSRRTLFHLNLVSLHDNNCYYKQDLYYWQFDIRSREKCFKTDFWLLPAQSSTCQRLLHIRWQSGTSWFVWATFIFRANKFDGWVVTQS